MPLEWCLEPIVSFLISQNIICLQSDLAGPNHSVRISIRHYQKRHEIVVRWSNEIVRAISLYDLQEFHLMTEPTTLNT
jgi:hypothetical protein